MEGNTLCHPSGDKVLKKFVEEIDAAITSSPIVLSSNIQKYFGPHNTVYLKGSLTLVDSSVLDIAIFITKSHNTLVIDKYRLHYMNSNQDMIFRYDNSPHHAEIDTYPHHKHLPGRVVRATMPSLTDVLYEISAIIVESR